MSVPRERLLPVVEAVLLDVVWKQSGMDVCMTGETAREAAGRVLDALEAAPGTGENPR